MSYFEHLDIYLNQLNNFINGRVTAENFVDEFFRLWKIDRDEESLEFKDHVNDPNHPLLVKLRANEITSDEFGNLAGMLLGMSETQARIRSVQDRIFTTCDCFWPDTTDDEADPPLVLSEKLFRAEIMELFQELELLCSTKNHQTNV